MDVSTALLAGLIVEGASSIPQAIVKMRRAKVITRDEAQTQMAIHVSALDKTMSDYDAQLKADKELVAAELALTPKPKPAVKVTKTPAKGKLKIFKG
jgi:hypothetical protein